MLKEIHVLFHVPEGITIDRLLKIYLTVYLIQYKTY
jgi:hypothetical protein